MVKRLPEIFAPKTFTRTRHFKNDGKVDQKTSWCRKTCWTSCEAGVLSGPCGPNLALQCLTAKANAPTRPTP